jgi:hypothetical protein
VKKTDKQIEAEEDEKTLMAYELSLEAAENGKEVLGLLALLVQTYKY